MKIIFKNKDNSIGIMTPTMTSIYICNKLGDINNIFNKNEDEIKDIIESKMDLEEAFKIATPIIAEKDVPSPYEYPIELEEKYENITLSHNEEDDEPLTQLIPTKWEKYYTPYWIVEDNVIPTDRTFRNAWEIDESLGNPNGFGGESNEFDSELLAEYLKNLKYKEIING